MSDPDIFRAASNYHVVHSKDYQFPLVKFYG